MRSPSFDGWPFRIVRHTTTDGIVDDCACVVIDDTNKITRASARNVHRVRHMLEVAADSANNGLEPQGRRSYRFFIAWHRWPRGPNRQALVSMQCDLWDSRIEDAIAAAKGLDL